MVNFQLHSVSVQSGLPGFVAISRHVETVTFEHGAEFVVQSHFLEGFIQALFAPVQGLLCMVDSH